MSDTTPQPEETRAPDAATPHKPLDEQLAEIQARLEEQRDQLLRALADADNARKRASADVAAAHKFGIERLAEALLPVVDSLEAALATRDADAATLRSGIELTLKQLRGALERSSLAEIAPAAGERFDPHRHQAMAAVEADAEANSVVEVMQKGWALHERVIRPALVTVAKLKPANDA